ncbi:MAG: hypothetical protein E7433_06715 [Ruminococcaceae bacterium]|nr:hypothetical protein [Oscillospiraceae bacterium]
MTLTEQIYAQALVLIRDLQDGDRPMLEMLCRSAEVSLRAKLRDGVTPEDCKADFVAAASLYALAAMSEIDDAVQPEQICAGDLTVRKSSFDAAACCLRYQAELMMIPYVKDRFAFMGV